LKFSMKHLIFCLLLISNLNAFAQTVTQLDKDLDHAAYLVNYDRREAAFSELNGFIKKHPSNHRAYYLRAINYYKDGNTKSALEDINYALKYRYNSADYHKLKGEILALSQKYKSSAESFETALRFCDTAFANYYFAAKSYYLAEEFQRAENNMKKFLEHHPENDSAKYLYAEILASNNNQIDALKIVNSMQQKGADFYRLRGIVYCKSEMYEYSLKDLNTALDLNPKLTDIYLWRGLAYYFSNKRDLAKADWQTALKYRHFKANNYLEKYR